MDTLRDEPLIPPTFEAAQKCKALFVKEGGEEEHEGVEEEMVSYYRSETGTKYSREGVGGWWEGKKEREEVVVSSVALPLVTIQIIAVTAPCTLFSAELLPCLAPKKKAPSGYLLEIFFSCSKSNILSLSNQGYLKSDKQKVRLITSPVCHFSTEYCIQVYFLYIKGMFPY